MKNRHVRDKLSEYIDGMLSEKEASAVREHLEHCPDCSENYDEMVKIIGHMHQMERLETPDAFVEQVQERMEKQSSLQRLIKGLFVPLKIKVPLELAGVAAAALLVIYIVGVRGKQHVYELAYIQQYQRPPVLQEQTPEAGTEVEEAITVIDEVAPQRKKAEPELKLEEEKGEKRDKRVGDEKVVAPSKKDMPASEPAEKRMERRAQVEDTVPQSKMVEEKKEPGLESEEETVERETLLEVKAPRAAKAQIRKESIVEIADKEKREAEKDAYAELTTREENLEDIIEALGGKIIESKYNKDTQVLESVKIEIPADQYQTLIQILEIRGDIQKPYPTIQEKDQEIITILLILKQ